MGFLDKLEMTKKFSILVIVIYLGFVILDLVL